MSNRTLGRREFIERAIALSAVGVGAGAVLAACKSGGGLTCMDVSGIAPADLALRETNNYVDASTDPEKNCTNCQLFEPAGADQCGTCTVVKGPIHPDGNCNLWAEQVA